MQVNENGTIAKIESLKVPCCRHCAKLLDMYSLRYKSIIFKVDSVEDWLRKLKLKQTRYWDRESTKKLLQLYKDSFYVQTSYDKKGEEIKRKKEKSRKDLLKRSATK